MMMCWMLNGDKGNRDAKGYLHDDGYDFDDRKDNFKVDADINDDNEYCDHSGLLDLQADCLRHLPAVAGGLGLLRGVWYLLCRWVLLLVQRKHLTWSEV